MYLINKKLEKILSSRARSFLVRSRLTAFILYPSEDDKTVSHCNANLCLQPGFVGILEPAYSLNYYAYAYSYVCSWLLIIAYITYVCIFCTPFDGEVRRR